MLYDGSCYLLLRYMLLCGTAQTFGSLAKGAGTGLSVTVNLAVFCCTVSALLGTVDTKMDHTQFMSWAREKIHLTFQHLLHLLSWVREGN